MSFAIYIKYDSHDLWRKESNCYVMNIRSRQTYFGKCGRPDQIDLVTVYAKKSINVVFGPSLVRGIVYEATFCHVSFVTTLV